MPDPARRALFRGQLQHQAAKRPPWALTEPAFLDACTRCHACIEQCPEHVLSTGSGGFPVFDPLRGECSFCGACAQACAPHALDTTQVQPPWHWVAQVRDGECLSQRGVVCRSCQDACGEQAIRFELAMGGNATPSMDHDRCTGCGACIATCPTLAIELYQPD
ncbi:ferredoxin-type protein NapF [Dyella sp.]|uniref:ferredoxin-type protein NapF n=1 Tax=Dyella sp. TaxID=1869338 RepID=UPI002ED13694